MYIIDSTLEAQTIDNYCDRSFSAAPFIVVFQSSYLTAERVWMTTPEQDVLSIFQLPKSESIATIP